MAAQIRARSVSVEFGDQQILNEIDLTVSGGQRVGLVGPNGVGKSTLLGTLAGRIRPTGGAVEYMPSSTTVGWLVQEPDRNASETVGMMIARRSGVADGEAELDAATQALAEGDHPGDDSFSGPAPQRVSVADRYDRALDRWMRLGCADFESRLATVCAQLGLAERLFDQPTEHLSGGEAARAGLAALLVSQFDVYLLDEPTNDLDLAGLAQLERWALSANAPMVIVSHDREFLSRTVTHVAELNEHRRDLRLFAGGWEAFLVERETARRHAQDRFDEFDAKRSALGARAQREREWASQGLSKAKRRPDDNDKHVRRFKMDQSEQLAGKSARTERAMERLEVVDEPRKEWELRMAIAAAPRSGSIVAALRDVRVERGDFTLGPITLTISAGERIALVGSNGAGKSTLLREVRARLGASVQLGLIEQARDQLSSAASLLSAFMEMTSMTVPEARTLLAKFGLGADDVHRPAHLLSPGERTRAALAVLQAVGTNCLILDEPTNHLDLVAIEQLEQALDTFDGTLILVTHDRRMLSRVRLTRRLMLVGGTIVSDEPL